MQTLITAFPWIQVALSVILIVLILLQKSEAGLGGAFGGDGASSFHTKRGLEKFLFIATIIVGILFMAAAIIQLLIRA